VTKKQIKNLIRKNGYNAEKYLLRLYITGNAPQSIRAVLNLKRLCERRLSGRYELDIIDIYKNPELAKKEQIIAAPTLVKLSPLPVVKLIGDLSNQEKVLKGLGLPLVEDSLKGVGD
jgi:circadian clock protein KaiB